MSEEKVVNLIHRKGAQMRKPFASLTGNPENGVYADWHDSLRDSSNVVAELTQTEIDKAGA